MSFNLDGAMTSKIRSRSGNMFRDDIFTKKSFKDDSSCNGSRFGTAKKRKESAMSTYKLKRTKSVCG